MTKSRLPTTFSSAEKRLETAVAREKAYEVPLVHGLSARIAADGTTKTLYWRGRGPSGHDELGNKIKGKVIRVRLGSYPGMTLSAAHATALEKRSAVKNGIDPNLVERRLRAKTASPATVREAFERFEEGALNDASEKWRSDFKRMFQKDVLPKIGPTRLKDLSKSDIAALVAKKAASLRGKKNRTGAAANRLRAALSRFFKFCSRNDWISSNPAADLEKPVKEIARDRVLSQAELGGAWIDLQDAMRGEGAINVVYARVLAMLATTGCRASEIVGLCRGDVSLSEGTIEIVRGKNDDSKRIVPLGPLGRSVLVAACEALSSAKKDTLVFPQPSAGGLIGSYDVSKAARTLVGRAKENRWRPHDLRRSAVSHLHEMGFDGDVVRRIVGHAAKDAHGRVYDRSTRLEIMRDALSQYEKLILSGVAVVAEKQNANESNVVSLRA